MNHSALDNIHWAITHMDPFLAAVLGLVAVVVLLNGYAVVPPLWRFGRRWIFENVGGPLSVRRQARAELRAFRRSSTQERSAVDRDVIVHQAVRRLR